MFRSLDSIEMLTSIDKTFVVYMISQHIPASESASELNRFEFEIGIIRIGSESVLKCESLTSLTCNANSKKGITHWPTQLLARLIYQNSTISYTQKPITSAIDKSHNNPR